MDWTALQPQIPLAEKIIRPLVVYFFLLFAFRIAGKRELGQITPFDLIILLTISNVLQNAMIGNDNSLGGGLIGAITLFVANGVISRLAAASPRFEHFLEGDPTALIVDGRVLDDNLRREVMTRTELERAIRRHDLDPTVDLPSIRLALLEGDGTVTIPLREKRLERYHTRRRRMGRLPPQS